MTPPTHTERRMVLVIFWSVMLVWECLRAAQIDILIVICSCFAPTPSLASMVVNHFKMRTDVLSHNLSGMGCSSGVIGIDMARHYLQVSTLDSPQHA